MTMQYNFLTGMYEDDGTPDYGSSFDTSGAYTGTPGYVLPDVSQGAPDMSPSTPTGNGTGYFVGAASSLTDLAKTALQYALGKDAAKNAAATQITTATQVAALQSQAAAVKAKQNMFLLVLVGAAFLFFTVEENK